MIVGSGQWDVVGSLFEKDRGVVGKFRGKSLLGFRLFCSGSKFGSGGDLEYFLFQRRTSVKEARSASDDLMEGSVCIGTH